MSWSGYLSVKADAQPLEKSVVTMLQVINLSTTNMTALHSLLCFVVEQSKNMFDQPLYVKAYEIVIQIRWRFFFVLVGFTD